MKVEVDVLGPRLSVTDKPKVSVDVEAEHFNQPFIANQPATSINHPLQPVCNISQPFTATSLPSERKPLESFHVNTVSVRSHLTGPKPRY